MIRLTRAAQAVPGFPSLALRGTRDGGIRFTGSGFGATVGGDRIGEVQTANEAAAARLSAVLAAASLAALPEDDREVALSPVRVC